MKPLKLHCLTDHNLQMMEYKTSILVECGIRSVRHNDNAVGDEALLYAPVEIYPHIDRLIGGVSSYIISKLPKNISIKHVMMIQHD